MERPFRRWDERYGKMRGRMFALEIDLGIVVAALEQLLHLLLRGDTGVGSGAGVADGVLGDLGQTGEEHVLGDEALLGGLSGP